MLEIVVIVPPTLLSNLVIHFVYDLFAQDHQKGWGFETIVGCELRMVFRGEAGRR